MPLDLFLFVLQVASNALSSDWRRSIEKRIHWKRRAAQHSLVALVLRASTMVGGACKKGESVNFIKWLEVNRRPLLQGGAGPCQADLSAFFFSLPSFLLKGKINYLILFYLTIHLSIKANEAVLIAVFACYHARPTFLLAAIACEWWLDCDLARADCDFCKQKKRL